jgi:hypothetical protein
MAKLILFVLMIALANPCFSQNLTLKTNDSKAQKFNSMVINGAISIDQLLSDELTLATITSALGNYSQIESSNGFDKRTNILKYQNENRVTLFEQQSKFLFVQLNASTPDWSFTYDGTSFKVGDNISNLSVVFKKEYDKRNGGSIDVYHPYADIYMEIEYNTSNVIVGIEIFHFIN